YARGVIGNIDITGNLEFQYHASSTGHEYITYVVTDHNGGYGIGLLDFTISTYPVITDTAQKLAFLPPMTMDSPELNLSSGSYYEPGSDGFQGFYPIFSHALASSYCITQGGRLPTEAELTTMWKTVINQPIFHSKFKWHSSLPYLTTTESRQVSLKTGEEIESNEPACFSCVISTEEPKWKFSNSFNYEKLNAPFQIYETVKLDNGTVVYRDAAAYKLRATTLQFLINGEVADLKDVNVAISGNQLTIDAKNVRPTDNAYIKLEVTDDDLVGQSSIVVVGVGRCPSGTTPEQSLRQGCIYSVQSAWWQDGATVPYWGFKFTLAIPMNVLGPPPEGLTGVKIFGKDGVSFIGIHNPNNRTWYNYVEKTCKMLNSIKMDGRTDWRAGRTMDYETRTYSLYPYEEYKVEKSWVQYMRDNDPEGSDDLSIYGQGFGGLPGDKNILNQYNADNKFISQKVDADTYTFASCVTEGDRR
ncbi:hypothetical protein I3262_19105, partial [Photobacterium damselae]|nr:hypothetical protein [Photobacterium damselae]